MIALFASAGSLSRPSPSIVNEIWLSFVGINSASFHRSKARPRASNPGPRLAVVAGTLMVNFITFLNQEGHNTCPGRNCRGAHEGKSRERHFAHHSSNLKD